MSKAISVRVDEDVYDEVEKIATRMKKARNRYINEALKMYNSYNRRKALAKEVARDAKEIASSSMQFLRDIDEAD